MACGAANSPLMGLPGEVRNRIYRYAVVEPEGSTIDIRTTRLQEPGLLTTCKDVSTLRFSCQSNRRTIFR